MSVYKRNTFAYLCCEILFQHSCIPHEGQFFSTPVEILSFSHKKKLLHWCWHVSVRNENTDANPPVVNQT